MNYHSFHEIVFMSLNILEKQDFDGWILDHLV